MSDEQKPKWYTERPLKIQAIKWTGVNVKEVLDFTGINSSADSISFDDLVLMINRDGLKIFTPSGAERANIGDYIVRSNNGDFSPCSPAIFVNTHYDV